LLNCLLRDEANVHIQEDFADAPFNRSMDDNRRRGRADGSAHRGLRADFNIFTVAVADRFAATADATADAAADAAATADAATDGAADAAATDDTTADAAADDAASHEPAARPAGSDGRESAPHGGARGAQPARGDA